MNKIKVWFCLFLLVLSFLYASKLFKGFNIISFISGDRDTAIIETLANKKFSNPVSFTHFDNKEIVKKTSVSTNKKLNKSTKIYIYNTHQTEEYAITKFGVVPTVRTVSDILQEELSDLHISSIVEKRDVISEVKKRNYDYSGTYTVSFEYLEDSKKKNPSLEYFFDIHRDSITGSDARVRINDKSYATLMFLIGANHKNYEQNVKNANIMKSYLDKNYKGLTRDNYIQKKWTYYQYYSPKMFLVEIGGPDNTFEEIYNTSHALAEAINYYIEVDNG